MDPQRFFSDQDREAIRAATAEAEGRTGGEIVSYAVERCDAYEEAAWKGAALGALALALAAGLAHWLGAFWGGWGLLWITLPAGAGAAAGFALGTWVPGLQRRLVTPEVLEQRVARRAAVAFVDEEVFATRDRTGVLLFLALFEHRVVVLADSGINARVEPAAWEAISEGIARGIREGRPAAALVEAIGACGRLLEEKGVARRPDDVDELGDELRVSDE